MRKLGASNKVLLILCLMYLILYVDRVNISTAAPLIKAELGLSNTQPGLVFSAFAYPYALFQLIGGYFGDKFGARLTLSVSGLIVCVATLATGAVGGLISLFVTRLSLGIGEGAAFPTATRAMSVWTPERRWAFAQGITRKISITRASWPSSSASPEPHRLGAELRRIAAHPVLLAHMEQTSTVSPVLFSRSTSIVFSDQIYG